LYTAIGFFALFDHLMWGSNRFEVGSIFHVA
jgi:hypothetical protein